MVSTSVLGFSVQPFLPRLLEQCHDVELNPGPRATSTNSNSSFKGGGGSLRRGARGPSSNKAAAVAETDGEETKIERLERELSGLQHMLSSLDQSMLELKESIESMRPAYNQALQYLAHANITPTSGQKNNLVFHGILPDELELQMSAEPEFCRDVLETRIKMVFREYLRISRDMPLTHIYRLDVPLMEDNVNPDQAPKPLLVGFKSLKDKDNILRHSNLLRREGIFVTEDCSAKKAAFLMTRSPKKTKANMKKRDPVLLSDASTILSDHMSSCNSDYAPSSHSGNSSSSAYTD